MKLNKHIQLLSGQHIEAANVNIEGKGTAYLTGPADFIGKKPVATKFTEIPKVVCEAGDILITVKGSGTGSIAIADQNYCISRQLMAIRCESIDPRFTEYLLEQNERTFNTAAAGLIPGISRNDVLNLTLPGIPLPEQKAIADLLSTWDSAIEKTERLIAAKEKRFQWLLDELINQNLNKHNWKNSSFAEIFEPSKNKYDASGELPVLSVTKDGIVLQSEYFNKEIASDDLNGYLIVDYNDFVMSGLNFWMGSVDFQTIVEQGIVSPAYKVYKVKTNSVTIDYLKFFVRSTSMTKLLITSSVMGASIVRRNLDKEMLENSVIKIPSPMEQEKIVSSLNLSNRELVALRNILSKYKEQKRGLMQKLLTGEWRVKEA